MSGGVDSSVAAALLRERGCDVVGVFMRLGSPGEELETGADSCDPVRIGHKGCCSINDAADARLVAAQLGIPFYVLDFKREFGRIIDYFVAEYAAGRTPNPCVRCNDWLKFGRLHEYARQIGADFVASGHYARIEPDPLNESGANDGGFRLLRGIDAHKDQSYVLFGAVREALGRMILPIGTMHKDETRDTARRLGLPVFDKPDSQEICFVPDDDYAGLVERKMPELAREGDILDTSGAVVGTHAGQHRFTIGQRRGVGVAFGRPIYVVGKSPEANTITVGERNDLLASGCVAGEANWHADPARFSEWTPCLAQHRYNADAVEGEARAAPDKTSFEVRFCSPQPAVTPGQAIVLYDADAVLGGGWIATPTPA